MIIIGSCFDEMRGAQHSTLLRVLTASARDFAEIVHHFQEKIFCKSSRQEQGEENCLPDLPRASMKFLSNYENTITEYFGIKLKNCREPIINLISKY